MQCRQTYSNTGSGNDGESTRPVALDGSHKLNTNWHIARRIRCISRVQLSSRRPLCLNGGTYALRYKFTDKYARQLVNASRVPPLILRTLPPDCTPTTWINIYLFTGPLPAGFHRTDNRTILINSIFCCGSWFLATLLQRLLRTWEQHGLAKRDCYLARLIIKEILFPISLSTSTRRLPVWLAAAWSLEAIVSSTSQGSVARLLVQLRPDDNNSINFEDSEIPGKHWTFERWKEYWYGNTSDIT